MALSACSQDKAAALRFNAMSYDDHLLCAAQISAYEQLMRSGKLEQEPEFGGKTLVAMMTHLNAFAMPQDLREPEGFRRLAEEREAVLRSATNDEIRSNARACIEIVDKASTS